jgi:hypothetical protein
LDEIMMTILAIGLLLVIPHNPEQRIGSASRDMYNLYFKEFLGHQGLTGASANMRCRSTVYPTTSPAIRRYQRLLDDRPTGVMTEIPILLNAR